MSAAGPRVRTVLALALRIVAVAAPVSAVSCSGGEPPPGSGSGGAPAGGGAAASDSGEAQPSPGGHLLYRSDAFTVTDTSVEQGRFRAVARSRDHLVSNYERAAAEVNFKFSLNGAESEFPPGRDHMIYLVPRDGRIVTPVYTFGELEPPSTPEPELAGAGAAEGPVDVTFRVDLREVLDSLRIRGVYHPPNGPSVTADDFQGVYVVGNRDPLSWDFSRLRPGSPVELTDPDGDGVYEVTLPFEAEFARPLNAEGLAEWTRRRDLGAFPDATSPLRLPDALYRLALEEVVDLRRPDGALDAGARWPGVWTRDLAWQTLLGLVFAAPDAVRTGLLARVDSSGRIMQDSGSGGSWPVSTDRVAWALAAWQLYAVEGDPAWLRTAYDVVRRSAEADLTVARDTATGLFRGESTFLDWREQSYPAWMEPRDIFRGEALGTNVLHWATYRTLGRMARALGEPEDRWEAVAAEVRRGVDRYLWQPGRGYHGQYRYGRLHLALSPRAEHLGEALAVVLGLTDGERSRRSVARMPVVPFGAPSFWPYIPGQPPYHNAAVWPQVLGFRAWAAAEAGNTAAVEHALANLYRGAALFLTDKENWVAATGHFEGTEVNSDRFGASVAAQLATVYRVLFGLRLEADRLVLRPFVPPGWSGTRTLSGLRYRDAVLEVTVHGFGDEPTRVLLDGEKVERAEVPAGLTGEHSLEITLDGDMAPGAVHVVDNAAAPPTPEVRRDGDRLVWEPAPGVDRWAVFLDGEPADTVEEPRLEVAEPPGRATPTPSTDTAIPVPGQGAMETPPDAATESSPDVSTERASEAPAQTAVVTGFQVKALGAGGLESFLSEPVRVGGPAATILVDPAAPPLRRAEDGYTGGGYADIRDDTTTVVAFRVAVPASGLYALDVRYANGHGAVSYGYRAALRTLLVDGRPAGTVVLPQRGIDLWDDWGYSSPVVARLEAGAHEVTLEYRPEDRNMDGRVNGALVDQLRVTRVGR